MLSICEASKVACAFPVRNNAASVLALNACGPHGVPLILFLLVLIVCFDVISANVVNEELDVDAVPVTVDGVFWPHQDLIFVEFKNQTGTGFFAKLTNDVLLVLH